MTDLRRYDFPPQSPEEFVRGWLAAFDLVDASRAEATAAAEQRLRERIEALTLDPRFNDHYHRGWGKHRAAVLALLSGGSPATPGPTGATADEMPPDGSSTPAASPRQGEPVDVERLARALHEAEVCLNWSPGYGYLDEHNEFHDDHGPAEHTEAARIAAEYAALSEPAEAGQKETN